MVSVKICGITNHQDALLAVELGVQALGFIFASSPRQVSPEKVRSIIDSLPPFIVTVGVFVDEGEKKIRDIAEFCGLQLIQLHGNEAPGFCRGFLPKAIKAFRLKDASSLGPIGSYQGHVRAIVLDSYLQGKVGGTGRTFPWDLAVKVKETGMPIILSGGLNPSNIIEAIMTVKPYAVDVNSGIEERPGKKDPVLMKRLMETVQKNQGVFINE